MSFVNGCEIPADLYYFLEGNQMSWLRLQGTNAVVGLTDAAQTKAGKILHVRVKAAGTQREKGRPVATIESGKWAGPVLSPVDCEVIRVNDALESTPSLINDDPYGKGWICEVKVLKPEQLASLVQGDAALAKWKELLTRDNVRCVRCQK
jgi:glycine cleavage system H protein